MVLGPETLKQNDIERLAAGLISEVYMIARFSPADDSRLSADEYESYRARHEGRL
jgi:hypothetical protein